MEIVLCERNKKGHVVASRRSPAPMYLRGALWRRSNLLIFEGIASGKNTPALAAVPGERPRNDICTVEMEIKKSRENFTEISCALGGLEPSRLSAHGPQPCLSANSSTSASRQYYNRLAFPVKQRTYFEET